nr:hypothetical protein B0A51_05081 [Rachicladosporium sp. CCFEE 5018]
MPASPARPPSVARLTASGIDLSDPDVQTVLRELVEMGITANQIEDNAGFIKTYLEQDKATAAAKAEKKERSARAPPPPPPGNLSPYHRTLTHDPVTHMVNSECDQFLKILLQLHFVYRVARMEDHTIFFDAMQNLGGNIDVADSLGNTALSLATSVGDLAAMKRLLDASALERRHVEAVELLLSKGANPTVTHADGWTALHSAAKYGDIEIIERLVKAGAELDTKTANGHTPVEIALDSKKLKAMEALVRLGATPVDPMLLI